MGGWAHGGMNPHDPNFKGRAKFKHVGHKSRHELTMIEYPAVPDRRFRAASAQSEEQAY